MDKRYLIRGIEEMIAQCELWASYTGWLEERCLGSTKALEKVLRGRDLIKEGLEEFFTGMSDEYE